MVLFGPWTSGNNITWELRPHPRPDLLNQKIMVGNQKPRNLFYQVPQVIRMHAEV